MSATVERKAKYSAESVVQTARYLTRRPQVDTEQQRDILGVHFRPGGAYAFLDLPVDEVQAQDVSLETFWGGDSRELHERLLVSENPRGRLAILEEILTRRLAYREVLISIGSSTAAAEALTNMFAYLENGCRIPSNAPRASTPTTLAAWLQRDS